MNWDLIGHEWAVELIRRHLISDRVRHAYLFVGPEAVGKRTLATRFAQALNCTAPPEPGGFCGNCRACRLIPTGGYPDLHLVEAMDSGGALKVDQVRQLQRRLALAPYEGRWRVALLPRFHDATTSAANALLKTLEEPPDQVVLLLTARSSDACLPTIVSRCEVIPLRPISIESLKNVLQSQGESPIRAALFAGLAGGRPGRALQLTSDPGLLERRGELLEALLALLQANRARRFQYAERATRGGDSETLRLRGTEALEVWLSLWRDVMLSAYRVPTSLSNPDCAEVVNRLAGSLPLGALLAALRATERTLDAIKRYANLRLAYETLMLDLPYLETL